LGPPLKTSPKRIGHTYEYDVTVFGESVLLAERDEVQQVTPREPPAAYEFGATGLRARVAGACPPVRAPLEPTQRMHPSDSMISPSAGAPGVQPTPAPHRTGDRDWSTVTVAPQLSDKPPESVTVSVTSHSPGP